MRSTDRPARRGAALLAAALLWAGCSRTPPPRLPGSEATPARDPLVLVPGVTGSELAEPGGRFVWGKGVNLLRPHDRGYATALPIAPGVPPRAGPAGVIEELRLAGVRLADAYRPVVEMLLANGYRRGDLSRPDAAADLYLFSYDWRQANTDSARVLEERLEALRRARGEETLRVDLLCQSNGAHICRYFAKYGGASLEEAEAGRASPPPGVAIDTVVLVGSSNGGSLRILRELHRGRRYVPLVGRHWAPETLFTFQSLYDDLPSYRRDLFFGPDGRGLDLDLYDAASWRDHGWSIYGRRAQRRLARGRHPELFGTPEGRFAFLQRALDRARRFQRLLLRDAAGFAAARLCLVQSLSEPTPERALVERRGDRWRILFAGDRSLERRPDLAARATSPGDGHATGESQLYLSPQELAILWEEPFYLAGEHFRMIHDPAAQRRLLEFLLRPARGGAAGGLAPRQPAAASRTATTL